MRRMKKICPIIGTVLLLFARCDSDRLPIGDNSEEGYRVSFDDCIKNSASSDMRMLECVNEELMYWDGEMAASYTKNSSSNSLSDDQKIVLKESQASWHIYRNDTCEIWDMDGKFGSGGRLNEAMCKLELTKERSIQLNGIGTVFGHN